MLHRDEIEFLFLSFELLRLERRQILLDLDLPQIDLWLELHSREKSCFKSERNELFESRGGRASDKIAISLRAASQILNKVKDFFESLKYYLRM